MLLLSNENKECHETHPSVEEKYYSFCFELFAYWAFQGISGIYYCISQPQKILFRFESRQNKLQNCFFLIIVDYGSSIQAIMNNFVFKDSVVDLIYRALK